MRLVLIFALLAAPAAAQQPPSAWRDLLPGNLDAWEILGDGVWTLRQDGVLVAHRVPDKKRLFPTRDAVVDWRRFHQWDVNQSWLYTREQFAEFDLELEYWVRTPGNGGVSIRDPSRAKYGISHPPDFSKTPSKLGYEIQINSRWPDKWTTGSIYGLAAAPEGLQIEGEWNGLRIESRQDSIRTFVNGRPAASHPGDPKRPRSGPIGLQLHDQFSVIEFRNVRIRTYE